MTTKMLKVRMLLVLEWKAFQVLAKKKFAVIVGGQVVQIGYPCFDLTASRDDLDNPISCVKFSMIKQISTVFGGKAYFMRLTTLEFLIMNAPQTKENHCHLFRIFFLPKIYAFFFFFL